MSQDRTTDSKRIAKNTLLLYIRMLFLMLISLYTSRVILNALGVNDFGIYNVVGGVVTMFSILSSSLSAAISRFITFELGKNDEEKLKKVFSASVTIQLILSIIIAILIEVVGVWFLNEKMSIPTNRLYAANWVMQFSVITFVINLISVPYNATIIAHERMSAFAYISILEGVGKLAVAFLIMVAPFDRLIFYSILMCAIAVTVRLVYGAYCKNNFSECTYHFIWDKQLLYRMFSFAGWNFIGSTSGILRDQGGNILINLFFGPAVNAARGIANNVNNAVSGFASNFMAALNPQITKSYASGDYEYMISLIFQGARLSFYMLLFLSLPILVNTHYILVIWLKLVPEHAVSFVQLILILTLSENLSYPLITAMLATGKIRNYQIVVGGLQIMNLPISYVCLKAGCPPEIVLVVCILLSQCCLYARLYMLRGMIGLSSKLFLKKVYINVIVVMIVAAFGPILLSEQLREGLATFVILCIVCSFTSALSIFYIGCNNRERKFVFRKAKVLLDKVRLII